MEVTEVTTAGHTWDTVPGSQRTRLRTICLEEENQHAPCNSLPAQVGNQEDVLRPQFWLNRRLTRDDQQPI